MSFWEHSIIFKRLWWPGQVLEDWKKANVMSTLKKDRKWGSRELQAHHSHLSPQLAKNHWCSELERKRCLRKATNQMNYPCLTVMTYTHQPFCVQISITQHHRYRTKSLRRSTSPWTRSHWQWWGGVVSLWLTCHFSIPISAFYSPLTVVLLPFLEHP